MHLPCAAAGRRFDLGGSWTAGAWATVGQGDVLEGAAADAAYRLESPAIAAAPGRLVVSVKIWPTTATSGPPRSVVAAFDAARSRWGLLGCTAAAGLRSRWADAGGTMLGQASGLALLPGGAPVVSAVDAQSVDRTVLRYAAATDSWEPLGRPRATEVPRGGVMGASSQLLAGADRAFLVFESSPDTQPPALAVRWSWHQACPASPPT